MMTDRIPRIPPHETDCITKWDESPIHICTPGVPISPPPILPICNVCEHYITLLGNQWDCREGHGGRRCTMQGCIPRKVD